MHRLHQNPTRHLTCDFNPSWHHEYHQLGGIPFPERQRNLPQSPLVIVVSLGVAMSLLEHSRGYGF